MGPLRFSFPPHPHPGPDGDGPSRLVPSAAESEADDENTDLGIRSGFSLILDPCTSLGLSLPTVSALDHMALVALRSQDIG